MLLREFQCLRGDDRLKRSSSERDPTDCVLNAAGEPDAGNLFRIDTVSRELRCLVAAMSRISRNCGSLCVDPI